MAKLTCPFCKTQFYPGFSSLAKWCSTDEFYVCRRCAKGVAGAGLKCPRCQRGVSNAATFAIVMGLVLALGTSVVAVPSYSDLQLRWEIQNIPMTTGPLVNGTVVRIHGTILGPPGTVVLDGLYQHDAWVWSGQNFNLSYGSLIIPVYISWMLTYGMVFSYGQSINANERQYQSGDTITLVGQAGTTNWSYPFIASEVAPYPYTFMDLGHAGVDAGFVAVPVAALGIALAGVAQTAWRKHRESVRWGPGGPHFSPGEVQVRRDAREPLPEVPLGERKRFIVRLPASRGSKPRYLDVRGSVLWLAGVGLFVGWFAWETLIIFGILVTPPPAEGAAIIVGGILGGMALQVTGSRRAHVIPMLQCLDCSTWNRPYSTTCRKCGAALMRPATPLPSTGAFTCPMCGRSLAQPWRVCPYCAALTGL